MTDIAIATAEALRELTGYVRPDAQRRWLDANGVRYVQDRRGHPKVAADVIAKLPRPGRRAAHAATIAAVLTARTVVR